MKRRILSCLIVVLHYSGVAIATDLNLQREQKARAYFGDDLLIDQDGQTKTFYSEMLSNKVVLINFMFTQCKEACPLMTQRLRSVRQQLGKRFGHPVHFLSLSVDAQHDTHQQLKAFAQKHKADEPAWRFLRAETNTMTRLLNRLGQTQENPTDHSTLLIAGKPSTAHWIKIKPDSSVEAITAQLQSLVDEKR